MSESKLSIIANCISCIGFCILCVQIYYKLFPKWKDSPNATRAYIAELEVNQRIFSHVQHLINDNPVFANAFLTRGPSLLRELGFASPPAMPLKSWLASREQELEAFLADLKNTESSHHPGWKRIETVFQSSVMQEKMQRIRSVLKLFDSLCIVDAASLTAHLGNELIEVGKKQQASTQNVMNKVSAERHVVVQKIAARELPMKDQNSHAILNITTFDDSLQDDAVGIRLEGAGKWFPQSYLFQNWLNTERQVLCLLGIPGAGKTNIATSVIEHLKTEFSIGADVGLAYAYCDYQKQKDQKYRDFLENLLMQLSLKKIGLLPTRVAELFDRNNKMGLALTTHQITQFFKDVVTLYSTVFIVVDALDECQCSEGLVSALRGLQTTGTRIKLVFTSRTILKFQSMFKNDISYEISHSRDDMKTYLEKQTSKLPLDEARKSPLREEIIDAILNMADGMFPLARGCLKLLDGMTAVRQVRLALKTFTERKQISAKLGSLQLLSHRYDQDMGRIISQPHYRKTLALDVLSWLTHATRPLKAEEIQHAMAVEPGESNLDEEAIPSLEMIASVCIGLVIVDQENGKMSLAHHTLADYFAQTQSKWFPEPQKNIATICVNYLCLDSFGTVHCQNGGQSRERSRQPPLFQYAALNWLHHAHKAGPKFLSSLSDRAQVEAAAAQGLSKASHKLNRNSFPPKIRGRMLRQRTLTA